MYSHSFIWGYIMEADNHFMYEIMKFSYHHQRIKDIHDTIFSDYNNNYYNPDIQEKSCSTSPKFIGSSRNCWL